MRFNWNYWILKSAESQNLQRIIFQSESFGEKTFIMYFVLLHIQEREQIQKTKMYSFFKFTPVTSQTPNTTLHGLAKYILVRYEIPRRFKRNAKDCQISKRETG